MDNKLKRVLSAFIEPDYKLRDEMYLEKLIAHISEADSTIAYIPMYMDWICQVAEVRKQRSFHSSVTTFALRVLALLAKDEERFIALQREGIIDDILQLFKADCLGTVATKQAFVSVLSALLNHTEGCFYIVKTELWKDPVQFCQIASSIYVTRDGLKFISDFIGYLLKEDSARINTVLKFAVSPLLTKQYLTATGDLNGKILMPALEVAAKIFEKAIFGENLEKLCIELNALDLECLAWSILNDAEEKEIVEKVSRLLTVIYFSSLQCRNKSSGAVTLHNFNSFQSKLYNMMNVLTAKNHIALGNKILVQCQIYWHKLGIEIPQEEDKRPLVFEDQLIILQLLPVMTSIRHTKVSENECMDSYFNKLFDLTSECTQRLAYSMRNTMTNQENCHELAHMAILNVLQLKGVIRRNQAVVVFQALIYALKDCVPSFNPYQHSGEEEVISNFAVVNPELLSSLLEVLFLLISEFHITWTDSMETVCIFTLLTVLLKNPNLTNKLAIQSLQLMKLVIQKFIPPNLALLVNTVEGSSISQLGPVLYRRMHDISWEVRDTALEVLKFVSCIAEDKFTAFQDHLLDNELCSLCVTILENDLESYVRASALSCLGVMVRVHKYWNNSLSSHNLPEKMMTLLRNESEGIVRREAASLMKELYHHQKIPKSIQEEVFQTMADAAVGDLYWEVQVNALSFWNEVIEQEMTEQGMIDGCFPSVTFSRENRKIVTLTEKEVKNRLEKALDKLSSFGCLQVLLASMEDCNIQVVEKAVQIVSNLAKLLSRYGVLDVETTLPDLISSSFMKKDQKIIATPVYDTFAHEHSKLADSPSKKNQDSQSRFEVSDKVIEAIVKEKDMKLLQEVFQNKMNCKDSIKTREVQHRIVTSSEFITTLLKVNLTDVITERMRWLAYCSDDLGSLLDDILASQMERESIAIDCY